MTQQLGHIQNTLRASRYDYDLVVDETRGYYQFDCSGMAGWVLSRSAPVAHSSVWHAPDRRPLAEDFHRTFAAITSGSEQGGWRRITRVSEVVPGDVVAWLRPREVDSNATGHVAFAIQPAARIPGYDNAFLLRVVDASSSTHGEDTRNGTDGFGIGTIALATTLFGEPTHYSWSANLKRFYPSSIVIARPLR